MPYPSLPLAVLTDDLVRCGDYTSWETMRRVARTRRRDLLIMSRLMESIPERGLDEPLWIEVWNYSGLPQLRDGHHRAVALRNLGIRRFPYRWTWRFPDDRAKPGRYDPLPVSVLEYLEVV